MNFFKTSLLASFSTGISFVTGLVSTKIIAQLLGPAGTAYTGQFGNIFNIILLLASGACFTGVTKYAAEKKDYNERVKVLSSGFSISFIVSIIMSVIVIGFSNILSKYIFESTDYNIVFILLGVSLFFLTFNSLFISFLNGIGEVKTFTLLNATNSILVMSATIVLTYLWGVRGVLTAAALAAPINFLILWAFLKKKKLIHFIKSLRLEKNEYTSLLKSFSIMSIVSGIINPAIQLFIRTFLISSNGIENAGLWQATTRISDYYLIFVYTVLGVYYIPKLSSLHMVEEVKKEVRLGFLRIVPAVIVVTYIIWLCRDLLITLLLTEEFRPMLPLLKIQLIGDVVKIIAWLLGYLMISKAMTKLFIITEIIFSIGYAFMSYYLSVHFGIIGPVYGFLINYIIYLLILIVFLRKYIF